ncbi:TonB-dependent receptor [Novosphingobium sp. FSY-8]|uniref:TonB-dependent receptor n=1 Tax=Novosphingobium ovatum TaxID=1908523 RepID=A0ABW9XI10_9SPHN|nr:TonB-dependent receptor [Novosphingobium ovatum]NBC38089.1 TonB-dependent receptor [Novosphingobium ovatum]
MKREFTQGAMAALLAGTCLTFAVPAYAADAAPAADAPAETGAIIVTARRRSETLQSTPVAISAVSTAMLESRAAANIGDLQGAAPGLLITQQNSGAQAANLSIRGLTYADIEKSQTPTVGVVVDGITIGTNTGQLQDAFDVEQIEVLRGPQGTLFGANTIGGVVNIRRSKPTMRNGAKMEFTYGQWNTWSGKALVNVGNGSTIGAKLWYYHAQSDGYYHNATRNTNAGWSKGDNYGVSVLWKPEGSMFDAQLTLEQSVQSFDPVVSNLTNSSEVFCAFIASRECGRNSTTDVYTTFGLPATSNYHAPAATLEMNFGLASDLKLTSITGWRHQKEAQTQDFDGSSTDLYYVDRRQRYTQVSQELRLAGKVTSNFDYVVGTFFFTSNYNLRQCSRVFGFAPSVAPCTFDTNAQNVYGRTESYALFGDFNWAFMPGFRLSFGGRWSHDNKELTNSFDTSGQVGSGNAGFSKFTPKVGLDWRPDNNTMLYASFSRGYRSGGFSPRAATAATASTPFQPETVDAFEIGAKLNLFDRKLQFNIAGFVSDYKNMQQNTTIPGGPTGNQTITSNVGGASIKGVEMDATLRITDNLKLTATASIMDSHFRGFVVGNACPTVVGLTCPASGIVPYNYSNNNLIYAPKFSGSVNLEHTLPTSFGKVVTNFGWRHISPYDEQISVGASSLSTTGTLITGATVNGNDARVRTVTQDLIDLSATVNFKLSDVDAYVRVFGRNLADVRTTTHAFTVAGLWSFGMGLEPRTYGATLGVKF